VETLDLAALGPLSDGHRIEDFCCGIATLDDWLIRRARNNQKTGASRTSVSAGCSCMP
jgi:hypothetical protein